MVTTPKAKTRCHSVKTITYERAEIQEKTVSAFLMMFLENAQEIGLFVLIASTVKVKMKEVNYSMVNKAQTIMASLVMAVNTR